MRDLKYYVKRCFFVLFCALLNTVASVIYWKKKKIVPPVKNPLLLKSATILAKEIRERKTKSEEVVQAYIDRILEVNPLINAVVQDNFEEALQEARKVDAFFESWEFSLEDVSKEKPLLGIPFTVKSMFAVNGFPHNSGSRVLKDITATHDAQCVAQLKNAGGIFLALTNVPEFGCTNETANYLYGRTCNPYDTTRTCGGSSGGESALIGAAGSVIGIGCEIYGSNRTPPSNCGIFGSKPTRGWSSLDGLMPKSHPSVEDYLSTGPICRYAEDLILMLNVLSINKKFQINPEVVDFRKLKIYYQTDVQYVFGINTDKEIVQAVRNAAFHFKTAYGVEIREVNIRLLEKTNALILHLARKDVNKTQFIQLVTNGRASKVKPLTELLKIIVGKGNYTLPALIILSLGYASIFYKDEDIAHYEKVCKELSDEFEELLDDNSIFLSPTSATTATYHNQYFANYYSAYWTGVFNILGLPAVQCPMGLSKNKLPIGIQVVSSKGNDTLPIVCVRELERVFGGWVPPREYTL